MDAQMTGLCAVKRMWSVAPSPHSKHSGEQTRLPDVAHTSRSKMNLELCRDVSNSQMLEKNKCCVDIFKPAWISVTQGSRFIRGPWEKKSGGVPMQTGLAGGPRHVQCKQRRLLPVEFLKKSWCFCYALCILCKPYREKSTFCKRKKHISQIPERQTVLYITMPHYVKILFSYNVPYWCFY